MNRLVAWALVLSAVIWPASVTAQGTVNKLDRDEANAVDAAVAAQMEEQEIVGLAIGLLYEGEIVYLKGYGFADLEGRIPVDTETVFNWASNTKPLCAVAAMQLVEQGRLDLDVDVRRYVPEFPDHDAKITMRQLLSHQSGILHYGNGRLLPGSQRNPRTRPLSDSIFALDMFSESPLLFRPGTRTSYSSYGYMLASAVVQRAGKQPFAEQIQERIARPLRMSSLQIDVATAGQPHWAVGYEENDDGDVVRAAEFAHYWKHGAGAYKSNIVDFARWAHVLLNRKLLKHETYAAMWRPQTLADGTKSEWGLGFVLGEQNGLKVSHNGNQDEATSRMVLYPDAGHGIVILTNCGHAEPGDVTTAIYAALEE